FIAPGHPEEGTQCPFGRGREDRPPPETLRLPEGAEDWIVRVVPNLYPAVERQEGIVHSPEHKRACAELSDQELELVAQLVRDSEAFWLVNEGRLAGSSLAHSHSQLAWV